MTDRALTSEEHAEEFLKMWMELADPMSVSLGSMRDRETLVRRLFSDSDAWLQQLPRTKQESRARDGAAGAWARVREAVIRADTRPGAALMADDDVLTLVLQVLARAPREQGTTTAPKVGGRPPAPELGFRVRARDLTSNAVFHLLVDCVPELIDVDPSDALDRPCRECNAPRRVGCADATGALLPDGSVHADRIDAVRSLVAWGPTLTKASPRTRFTLEEVTNAAGVVLWRRAT